MEWRGLVSHCLRHLPPGSSCTASQQTVGIPLAAQGPVWSLGPSEDEPRDPFHWKKGLSCPLERGLEGLLWGTQRPVCRHGGRLWLSA